jgi:hypothetical protein
MSVVGGSGGDAMIMWIWRLIFGKPLCVHKWKIIREANMTPRGPETCVIGMVYVLQCEHCGDIKDKTIQ